MKNRLQETFRHSKTDYVVKVVQVGEQGEDGVAEGVQEVDWIVCLGQST